MNKNDSSVTMVPIVWREKPFNGRIHRDVRPAGFTIAEIVASVPELPDRFWSDGVVCVSSEPVPRELWGHVRPKPDSDERPIIVTLHLPLRGGGGGGGSKNTIALIATIAVLVAATAVSAGALGPLGVAVGVPIFGAGAIAAQITGAAIGLGGELKIGVL